MDSFNEISTLFKLESFIRLLKNSDLFIPILNKLYVWSFDNTSDPLVVTLYKSTTFTIFIEELISEFEFNPKYFLIASENLVSLSDYSPSRSFLDNRVAFFA